MKAFFELVDTEHPFKVGLDSCNVSGVVSYCKRIATESLDTCEGGRFSCYIGPDMMMVPCSFGQEGRYQVSLRKYNIVEAWNTEPFERFRDWMRKSCPDCRVRDLCMGGCPLMPEIVFCDRKEQQIR